MRTFFNVLVLAALTAAAAWSDIGVVFDNPDQIGHPGDTLQFFGVISNTGSGTVFLNGDSLTLAGLSFTITDWFLTNVPISLDGSSSSDHIELFDVTVSAPLLDLPDTYQGSYTLIGGIDDNAQVNLASAGFSVTTAPSVTTVPEPGSWLLLGTMLLGTGMVHRLSRRRT